MLGFRGVALRPSGLCRRLRLGMRGLAPVREKMGLTNLKVMVPFVRREEEARRVIAAMARNG